jgi:hypothetical protein
VVGWERLYILRGKMTFFRGLPSGTRPDLHHRYDIVRIRDQPGRSCCRKG